MPQGIFNDNWYRVAEIKPRFKTQVNIQRHVYRGQVWYVMHDRVGGKLHRFSAVAYWLVMQMDGKASVQALWEAAIQRFDTEAPSQTELLTLLGQLYQANALLSDASPNIQLMLKNMHDQQRRQWIQKIANPMAIKIPLWDPDTFLNRTQHWVKPLFAPWFAAVWVGVVLLALLMAGQHWARLTHNLSDTVLTPSNLLILACIFPVIKLIHELAHAYATKHWDGEVHEIGMMFLIFMPVPYVNASSSSAFSQAHQRMLVAAAGMLIEIAIAAVALLYWVSADEGVGKVVAYNIVLIAGISTLLFNANPLLRFDGYYILADLLQIPNLYNKAQQYFLYMLKRYALRLPNEKPNATSLSERAWFLSFAVSSYLYRVFISVSIALFIANEYFVVGMLLAAWSLFNLLAMPVIKGVKFMLSDGRIKQKPLVFWGRTASLLGFCFTLLTVIPMPYWTHAQGVLWLPQDAHVRAGHDCIIKHYLAAPDQNVQKGQPVIQCADPFLMKEIDVNQARYQEAEVEYIAALAQSSVKAEIKKVSMNTALQDLQRTRQRKRELIITATTSGRFVLPKAQDLIGKFVKQGEVIAYVIPPQTPSVRAVVLQQDVDKVRYATEKIELWRASHLGQTLIANIERELSGGTNQLPSKVLGVAGGGDIPVDPRDQEGLSTFSKVFLFDLTLEEAGLNLSEGAHYNERVFIRFYHGNEPLMERWLRFAKVALMEKLNV